MLANNSIIIYNRRSTDFFFSLLKRDRVTGKIPFKVK